MRGSETCTSFRQVLEFRELGFNLHDTMIWVKDGGGSCGSNRCYAQNTEYMFVLSKGKLATVNLIRDHQNSHFGQVMPGRGRRSASGTIRTEGVGRIIPEYSRRNNWWLYPRFKSYGNHPAAFPEGLARDHIISWSNPGDLVLDPFMGSGTTAKAAITTGRNFIGFDISKEYCQLSTERISHLEINQSLDNK